MLDSLGVKRYRTVRLVGRGGMGELYEVWDLRLERRVAVKRLHPHVLQRADSDDLVLSEARAAARVEHPNVVRVYGVEQAGPELLIEMQFIEGQALSGLLNHLPLPIELAVDLLRQVMEGLAACHAQNVVHCDLKPANVLVQADGSIYITDFGIARALRTSLDDVESDASVSHWGTPRYSPPEAWEGASPTPLWDIYAAGVLVYEALTGLQAFDGDTVAGVREQVYRGLDVSVRVIRPELSEAFGALIDSMISRDPEKRPQTAQAVLRALRKTPEYRLYADRTVDSSRRVAPKIHITETVQEAPPVAPVPVRKGRGRPILLGVGVALAAIVLFAGVWLFRGKIVAPPAPDARPSDTVPIAPQEVSPPKGSDAPLPAITDEKPPEPESLCTAGEVLYFSYDDGVHGRELWGLHKGKTPMLVADLNPGPASSDPHDFVPRDGTGIYFAARNETYGDEVWVCMGQDGRHFLEPQLVRDVSEGVSGSSPDLLFKHGITLYFTAATRQSGRELWWTTGGPEQTAMVADWLPGFGDGMLMRPRWVVDETGAYLIGTPDATGQTHLARLDFETNQLTTLAPISFAAEQMCELKGKIYFQQEDADHGYELWVFDPAVGHPQLFVDLEPGKSGSQPNEFYVWHDRLYFRATVGDKGFEPWVSDGTVEGTKMLLDINPGTKSSDPYDYRDMGDALIFRAFDVTNGRELWVTDGNPDNTYLIKDIAPGAKSSEPYNTGVLKGRLFFSADDDVHGEELWEALRVNNVWTARLVKDIDPLYSSFPHDLCVTTEGKAYFRALPNPRDPWLYELEIQGDEAVVQPIPKPEVTP